MDGHKFAAQAPPTGKKDRHQPWKKVYGDPNTTVLYVFAPAELVEGVVRIAELISLPNLATLYRRAWRLPSVGKRRHAARQWLGLVAPSEPRRSLLVNLVWQVAPARTFERPPSHPGHWSLYCFLVTSSVMTARNREVRHRRRDVSARRREPEETETPNQKANRCGGD